MTLCRSAFRAGIPVVLAVGLAALAAPSAAVAQPAKDVNVVNTPSVNATVTNSAANPVHTQDVDATGRQPVMASSSVPFPDGQGSVSASLFLTGPTFTLLPEVPAGKRLVAQFLSVTIEVPQGQKVFLSVASKLGNASMGQPIVLPPPITLAGADTYIASQTILVYVDPEGTVDYFVTRAPSAGAGHVVVTMTGSLVDAP